MKSPPPATTLAEFTAIVEASPEAVVLHYHKLHGTKRYSIDANARASKWRITFTWANPTILTATAPQSTSGVIRIWAAAEVTDGVRGDIPLAEIPQGLCDQATGATRQREVPSRIPPEYDLAIAQAQSSRRTIRLVNQTGRHLGAETKLVGGHLG